MIDLPHRDVFFAHVKFYSEQYCLLFDLRCCSADPFVLRLLIHTSSLAVVSTSMCLWTCVTMFGLAIGQYMLLHTLCFVVNSYLSLCLRWRHRHFVVTKDAVCSILSSFCLLIPLSHRFCAHFSSLETSAISLKLCIIVTQCAEWSLSFRGQLLFSAVWSIYFTGVLGRRIIVQQRTHQQ